ncbi:MAG: diaminopimelate decarboxylase family protein [Candidatus Hodarchaeota archaeon]
MIKITERDIYFDGISREHLFKITKSPVFLFFKKRIQTNCENFKKIVESCFPDSSIFYSVKTNSVPEILNTINHCGYGAQIISAKELNAALAAGFPEDAIIFDGIFHDDDSIKLLKSSKHILMNESWISNLKKIQNSCEEWQKNVNVGLRFAFQSENKWLGFSSDDDEQIELLAKLMQKSQYLNLKMISSHAGSQIMNSRVFIDNCKNLLSAYDKLENKGLINKNIQFNLGGGFPEPEIATNEKLDEIFLGIKDIIQSNHSISRFSICFEPGRYIVADAGILISKINQLFKDKKNNKWALLDIGMDVISRFANSHYRFFSLEHAREPHGTPISFQGRVPTEQDVLGKGIHFAKNVKINEHVLVLNCGAYSYTFSRRFNFKLPKYFFIEGEKFSLGEFDG